MKMSSFLSIDFQDDQLVLIDQTKLPLVEEYIKTDELERISVAIERLEVRGAPAIGITAAYAIALALKGVSCNVDEVFNSAYKRLASTRPTAVNLFWALDEMRSVFEANKNKPDIYGILLEAAKQIHQDDIEMCNAMGKNGLGIFEKKSNVLTHCNTGRLATGGEGTAFSVIKTGYENGLVKFVYSDETRPLLQGSRLTAFELAKNGIPFAMNTDSTAAVLMKEDKVDLVITGADRIAVNGDSANKIGTYNLAVLCKHHNIPFYITAPTTTIDLKIETGNKIKIEERGREEINQIKNVQVTRPEYDVYSPAFDVTPNELISGIITEKALHRPPYNFK
ncbi:MAG: S-methyl-5-thioribose-1-phosphate isomerase [Melioribacteraceae bacterium]|nr:S-methyl-5-thioribose-1-phosphate isomerase [Melioribacteraceae bacterium]